MQDQVLFGIRAQPGPRAQSEIRTGVHSCSELSLKPGGGLSLWSELSLRLGLGLSLRSRVAGAGPGPSVESGLGLGPESSRDLAAVEAGT